MTPLFVDTSGWASFFDRDQPYNDLAHMLLRETQMMGRVVSTSYVLSELAALLISPLRFHHSLRQEISGTIRTAEWVDIVHISPDLVDCSSFVLMKERGIRTALTTDRHFEQAGFVRLLR